MPTLLINRADIATYRQISETVYDNVLDQHILDAQFVDVQKLLGSDFYNDLVRNNTDTVYQTLLNGGDYTHQGTTYTNVGLKAVLVHYSYARYVLFGSQIDTPFSYVEKLNDASEKVDLAAKKTTYKNMQNIAYNYWENVELFLDRSASANYPLWRSGCYPTKNVFRISRIG